MKILVAIEGSQFSDKGLAWAIEYSKRMNAKLIAVTVVEDINQVQELVPSMAEVVNKELIAKAKEVAERAKKSALAQGVDIESIVLSGTTAQEVILDRAAVDGVDLIVVGSRGRKGLNRFVMGSVASRIVRHAPCTVTVVR